jgi:DNA-binding response OmpR family regulator
MTRRTVTMSAIVIFEDDDLMYELLREWLTRAGYGVRDPSTRFEPNIRLDLGIVSIKAPKVEGDAGIQALQREQPGVPIIALTCRARSGLSCEGETARALGVHWVIAKPLTRHALLAAVEALIGSASP